MKSLGHCAVTWLAALFIASAAQGAVIVDQEQPLVDASAGFLGIGGDEEQKLAQSFTVGVDGDLAGLRLPIIGCGSGDLVITIRRMIGGRPGGPALRTLTVPPSDVPFTFTEFTDFLFATPLAVNAGDVLAFTVETVGAGSFCSYATPPGGDLYSRGEGFFDARPNPPGWEAFKGFPTGPQDLPFATLMDDPGTGGGGSARNCIAQTSGGAIPTPIDFYTPACRCFEDRTVNEFRCGFLHPDFIIVRRIPFPVPPGRGYVETWQFTPITRLDGPVRMRISGGGLAQDQKFEWSTKGASRRTQFRRIPAVAPKEAIDVKGLAIVEYDMQDAQSALQKTFGVDTTIYADQVGR